MNILSEVNQSVYGLISFNIIKAMHSANKDFCFHPLDQNVDCPTKYHRLIEHVANHSDNYYHHNNCLKIAPLSALRTFVGNGKHFSYSSPQSYQPTELEKKDAEKISLCFLSNKNFVLKNSVYVPCGVDREIFNEKITTENSLKKNSATKFLACGKWSLRNGYDRLLSCFSKAFSKEDNVILIINANNPYINPELNQQWKDFYLSELAERVVFVPRMPYQTDLAELYSSVDCGVFYSRSEGASMCQLEMLSCGKHIISTDCGQEFINEQSSLLINCKNKCPDFDGKSVFGESNSLDQDTDEQLIEHMRFIHKTKMDYGLESLNFCGIMESMKYPWLNTVDKILKEI